MPPSIPNVQQKEKQLAKPWITKGIRASIKIENNLYLSGDDAKYKDYRNKISLLTRLSKKQYFSKYLKGTWEGINNLLNRKKKQSVTISVLKQPNSNSITNIKSRICKYRTKLSETAPNAGKGLY